MQRLGRIMVALGVLATLGMAAAAVLGIRGIHDPGALRVHVLTGLIPLLLFVLSHLWIVIYLFGTTKVLNDLTTGAGQPAEPGLATIRRVTLPAAAVALTVAIGCFLLGIVGWGGWVPSWIHGAAFYLAVAAEAFAAWREWRAFAVAERSIRRVEAAA